MDVDLYEALDAQAKRRKQDKAELIHTFIRDGLAHYDSNSKQILQTQPVIMEQLKMVQDLMAAAFHPHVEQQVLGLPQEPNETLESYKASLQRVYRKQVFDAIAKGGHIVAPAQETSASGKVSQGH